MSTSGRQLLLDALSRRRANRIPVVPFVHLNYLKAFYGHDDVDPVTDTIRVYEHFGFDIIHRNCTPSYDDIKQQSAGWNVQDTVLHEGRDVTTSTIIRTPGRDLTQLHRVVWVGDYDAEATATDYLVKSEADFEAIAQHQPPVAEIDVSEIVRAREALADRGVTAPWVQGAFNHVAFYYRRIDDLLMDAVLNPGFYQRMMEYFLERNMRMIAQYLDAGADLLSYAGNIASARMVGPDFFEEHVFPYEKRLIDYIQSRGGRVLYHNCGYARNLFPLYRRLGMAVYESLTPPPQGDTSLDEALETIGPEITLHGGLDQIRFLMSARPSDVGDKVRELLDVARERDNYIPGTSDYFHENTPHENIAAIAEAAREFGCR